MLYDNGTEADPNSGEPPQPVQLLHFRDGKIQNRVSSMPNWAKPIAAVVMRRPLNSSSSSVTSPRPLNGTTSASCTGKRGSNVCHALSLESQRKGTGQAMAVVI